MKRTFGRIIAQTVKELRQILRDRFALVLALLLPCILLVLLGNAISLTVTDLPITVMDLDNSPMSREFIESLRSSLTFRVVAMPGSASPESLLLDNEARAVIVIPQHFEHDVQRHIPVQMQALVDATDSNTATIIRGAVGSITSAFVTARLTPATGPVKISMVRPQTRLWYNPGRIANKFYGPGIFVLGLSIFPPLMAALSMSREGEQKTILQVYVSSISAHEFILGKVLAGMTIGIAQAFFQTLLLFTLFKLSFAGDPTPFIVATLLYLFCAVSFGTFVGAGIPNMAAAVQVVSIAGFLLSYLLSGLIFPVENIPDGLRWVSGIIQARYYIEIVRDVFLRGGGWKAVWPSVIAIGLIGGFFYMQAWRVMRKMQVKA